MSLFPDVRSLPLRPALFDRQISARPGGPKHQAALVSTVAATPHERRLALAVLALSAVAFFAMAPFARVPLAPLPAFIPAYEAALVLIDLITAVLLFGQFAQLRSPALLALAGGYLFDALMIVPHALSFPGLISPTGWLGAGAQTTAWLYMLWHGGFPLFIIAYAGLKRAAGYEIINTGYETVKLGLGAVIGTVLAVVVLAALLSFLATHAESLLPAIMAGNGYTPAMKFVVGATWALSTAAVLALLLNRPYSVLDLWLIVVMGAWLFDIALSAILNAGRFDLGFYAGRLYGLLAVVFVLGVILIETGGLYARLAAATEQLEDYAANLNRMVQERTAEVMQTHRELSAVVQASPLAIFMLDRDGVVVLWTASAERVFGYSEKEALGRLPPYLVEAHMADFRDHLVGAVADAAAAGFFETRRSRKDGTVIDVSVRWARVNDDETGDMLGIMYAVADITERKKLEGQLQQAQKMEAVGNLTGGLAHDFNNLLGIIILNLDFLRDTQEGDADAASLTNEAMDAALRGAELIRRLLAFARRQPLQPERTEVNKLVSEITKLLDRLLGQQVKISLNLGDEVWPTVIDPAQLESSIANLATNARDAMPNGGRLTIATGNRELDEDYASLHAEVTPGEYAMIEVSDSGKGIPAEMLEQVFEPFFTTKAPGKGTGLGLSMVYGFIKQSGGHINVYSEVGVGTTIRLYLPRADAEASAAEKRVSREYAHGTGELVLAVEDNPSLRRVVVRQLSEIGYRVIEAEDARSALAIIERESIAVLFTDVVLPGGTSGFELARTVAARWPGIRVVLTSGFPETRMGEDTNLLNVRLLSKPYRREDLARVIHQALDETVAA